jgi:hypothetical protein
VPELERLDPEAELLAARARQLIIAAVAFLDGRYVRREELPGEMDDLLTVAVTELRAIRDEQPEPAAAA